MAAPARPTDVRLGPPWPGSHAYFDALVACPFHYKHWTLRSQAQIDSLKKKLDGPSRFFFYDPVMDAAKYYRPVPVTSGPSIPLGEQLKMFISSGGAVLVIHDFWYGPEWCTNRGTLRAMKTFQIRLGDEKRFWTHTNDAIQYNRFPNVGRAHNSASLASVSWPQGRTKGDPLEPAGVGAVGTAHYTHVGKWTRYFQLLEVGLPATDPRWDAWKSLSPACAALTGTWTALSCWLADEDRDPVRIHYRVPVSYFDLNGVGRGVNQFEYEFNTSTSEPALTGPLIGYGRNVVVLKNYPLPARPEDDTFLFQRPIP